MLNPKLITDAIVAQLQNIPALAEAMTAVNQHTGDSEVRIWAFHYLLGEDNRLAKQVYDMPAPSMLVAWESSGPGLFDGQTLFKHRFEVHFRMGNAVGQTDPVGYEDLWWLVCNGIPAGSTLPIRYMNLLPGLEIMDIPGIVHMVDGEQFDRFRGLLVLPEIGDQGVF